MMMSLEIIQRLAELGEDLPVNIVIQEEDKYYDIDYITFDDEIYEFVIVAKDGTGAQYSTRGRIHEPE